MAELKTKPTEASVDAFLDAVADPQRRADSKKVCAMMGRLSGAPAVLWGPSIIGFGTYQYKYASGREGIWCRIAFSPRAKELVLYGLGVQRNVELMARLGKHKTGKGCLYIKKLSDVDEAVLEQLIAAEWADMKIRYPQGA